MPSPLRHFASILALPFVVVVVVPAWLLTSWSDQGRRWQGEAALLAGRVIGAAGFTAGLIVFIWCVVLFARVGRGTLAPWDPTQRLVMAGPYRYVRNPMISSVAAMLVAEALYFGSLLLAGWSLLFVVINHLYFIGVEEPGLVRRFGRQYVDYANRVPRWVPPGVVSRRKARADDA